MKINAEKIREAIEEEKRESQRVQKMYFLRGTLAEQFAEECERTGLVPSHVVEQLMRAFLEDAGRLPSIEKKTARRKK